MREVGIDISRNKTKSAFDLYQRGKLFSYVVTVCDAKTAERCPNFPGLLTKTINWSINVASSAPYMVRKEVMDAFIQTNQNIFLDEYLAKWFELSLKHRPKGNENSYRIYSDSEEQDDFDTPVTQGVSVYVEFIPDPTAIRMFGEPEYIRTETARPGYMRDEKVEAREAPRQKPAREKH